MGGMAAQIPIKDDPIANEKALAKVQEDKEREALAGHDGTWIAHPGLASIALDAFNSVMPEENQLKKIREDVKVTAKDLLKVPKGDITEEGLRDNIRVGIQYIESWLSGNGCVPLYYLMEDAATAEISRAQIWQWIHHKAKLNDGREINTELFEKWLSEELILIESDIGSESFSNGLFDDASNLFSEMIKKDVFDEFLTLPAYELLINKLERIYK
jgi:malate synthase